VLIYFCFAVLYVQFVRS